MWLLIFHTTLYDAIYICRNDLLDVAHTTLGVNILNSIGVLLALLRRVMWADAPLFNFFTFYFYFHFKASFGGILRFLFSEFYT